MWKKLAKWLGFERRQRQSAARRLAVQLDRRGAVILDRYGLRELADDGLSRSEVFQGMYELILTGGVAVRTTERGDVMLVSPAAAAEAEQRDRPVSRWGHAA